jgi:hypothetical protein
MSNNKSRQLARKTGSHLVGVPLRAERRFEDVEEHRAFVLRATGKISPEEAIAQFIFILSRYKTNSEIVDRLSSSTGLAKDALKKQLDLYSRIYRSPAELWELFGRKQW